MLTAFVARRCIRANLPTQIRHFASANDAAQKDLIVVGGGVAGYVAAIKAGQAGLKV